MRREELALFARSSAANFLVEHAEENGAPMFRLFHQAFNDALLTRRRSIRSPAVDQAAIARAMIAQGRSVGWDRAPTFLLRSLPGHVARAGLVEELQGDDGYLLHADLLRLLGVAHRTPPVRAVRPRSP